MDGFRYGLTVLMVCLLPPFVLYWPIVHGFVGSWRRLGPAATFIVMIGGWLACAAGIFQLRDELVVGDYGTRALPIVAGVGLIVLSGGLRRAIQRELSMAVLVGMPELEPEHHRQRLVTSGVYGRIRHPRYAQFIVGLLGYALVANYLTAYLTWLLWLPGVYVLVLFEERELRERFGEAYERYCREVPRFVPKPGSATG